MKISAGCSTVGSALRSGRRGRKFESSHPDRQKTDSFAESVFLCPDVRLLFFVQRYSSP